MEWEIVIVIGALIGLLGGLNALAKPSRDREEKRELQIIKLDEASRTREEKAQCTMQELVIELALLNSSLIALIKSDDVQNTRLDRHKVQLYNHEGRLNLIEGIESIKRRLEED